MSDEPRRSRSVERRTSSSSEADVRGRAAAAVEVDLDATRRASSDEVRELAQRVQADFENYRKRMLPRADRARRAGQRGISSQLLPVLDNFELALASLDDADETVRKGVELRVRRPVAVLEKAGLERIDADGKPFDPNEHEAVAQEDGDGRARSSATSCARATGSRAACSVRRR